MRNPNGYGSVNKLSGNRRKPWAVRIPVEFTDEGVLKRKYIGYFATRKEAITFLAMYNQDKSIIREVPTFEEFYDRFIRSLELKNRAQKTLDMYNTTFKYFKDIEDEKITDVKASIIQDIIDDLVDDGYGYSTVHKVKTLASQLFKLAMSDDYINKNYAQFVELPRAEKKEVIVFDNEELVKMKKAAKNDIWASTILIMIYGIMRVGTLLNVKKFDIDFEKNIIRGGNKTEADKNKIVPIHPVILPYLKYWYNTGKSEYLITRDNKNINYRYYLDSLYYPALDNAGVERKSTHTCKRTGVTLLRRAGADELLITSMAGHTSKDVHEKYYTAVDINDLNKAILKIK